jgi:hypothetical protein
MVSEGSHKRLQQPIATPGRHGLKADTPTQQAWIHASLHCKYKTCKSRTTRQRRRLCMRIVHGLVRGDTVILLCKQQPTLPRLQVIWCTRTSRSQLSVSRGQSKCFWPIFVSRRNCIHQHTLHCPPQLLSCRSAVNEIFTRGSYNNFICVGMLLLKSTAATCMKTDTNTKTTNGVKRTTQSRNCARCIVYLRSKSCKFLKPCKFLEGVKRMKTLVVLRKKRTIFMRAPVFPSRHDAPTHPSIHPSHQRLFWYFHALPRPLLLTCSVYSYPIPL